MQTHEQLHAETLNAARREKSATLELLGFLNRIEGRRTFAVLGYPSLFKYVEEGLGYSPAQASERVSAARLLRKVPFIAEKLAEGAHTLTSVAKIASHVRRENLNQDEASALVLETANQSILSLEKHLLGVSTVEPPKFERAKPISRELTRLTLDVDDEFMDDVIRMRELNGNPALPLSDIFQSAMREFIAKRTPRPAKKEKPANGEPICSGTSVAEVQPTRTEIPKAVPARSRYIRRLDRNRVRLRAGDQCEYRHEETGRRCGSRYGLQFEHVVPFGKGGTNSERNLKLYCPTHNRLRAIQAYGEEKMRPYLGHT